MAVYLIIFVDYVYHYCLVSVSFSVIKSFDHFIHRCSGVVAKGVAALRLFPHYSNQIHSGMIQESGLKCPSSSKEPKILMLLYKHYFKIYLSYLLLCIPICFPFVMSISSNILVYSVVQYENLH